MRAVDHQMPCSARPQDFPGERKRSRVFRARHRPMSHRESAKRLRSAPVGACRACWARIGMARFGGRGACGRRSSPLGGLRGRRPAGRWPCCRGPGGSGSENLACRSPATDPVRCGSLCRPGGTVSRSGLPALLRRRVRGRSVIRPGPGEGAMPESRGRGAAGKHACRTLAG